MTSYLGLVEIFDPDTVNNGPHSPGSLRLQKRRAGKPVSVPKLCWTAVDRTPPVARRQSHLLLGCVELPLVQFSVSERDDDAGRACTTQTLHVL